MERGATLTETEVKGLKCPDLCFFGVVYRTDSDTLSVARAYVDTEPQTTNATTNDDGSFVLTGLKDGNRYEVRASYGGQLTGSIIKVAETGDNRVISIYLGATGIEIPLYEGGEISDPTKEGSRIKRSG